MRAEVAQRPEVFPQDVAIPGMDLPGTGQMIDVFDCFVERVPIPLSVAEALFKPVQFSERTIEVAAFAAPKVALR